MKKMLFILLSLNVTGIQLHAQKPHMGVQFGGTFGSYKTESDGLTLTAKVKPAVTFGLAFEVPMGNMVTFRPALNFVQKGGKLKMAGLEDKLTTNFLEVPLNITVDHKTAHGKFFAGAGPSLSMGLGGKDKWTFNSESGTDKVKFGKNKDFKKVEAGVGVLAGYRGTSGLMIAASYNTSVSNAVSHNDGYNSKFYNRYYALRIGYMF